LNDDRENYDAHNFIFRDVSKKRRDLMAGRRFVRRSLWIRVGSVRPLAIKGPEIRAAADAQEARTIEEENRAFCGQLGVGPETSRYADCAAGLKEIRERHLRRSLSDSIL
jgi:hypothetical protein